MVVSVFSKKFNSFLIGILFLIESLNVIFFLNSFFFLGVNSFFLGFKKRLAFRCEWRAAADYRSFLSKRFLLERLWKSRFPKFWVQ